MGPEPKDEYVRSFDDFTLPGFWQNPFPFYQRSFENADRIQTSPGGGIAVLGYDDCRAIGLHPAVDGTPLPPIETEEPQLQTVLRHGVFAQIQPDHRLYRKAALSGLNHSSIKEFAPRALDLTDRLLARSQGQPVDLVTDVCLTLAAECWAEFSGYGKARATALLDDIHIAGQQLSFDADPAQAVAGEEAAASLLSLSAQAISGNHTCPVRRMSDALGKAKGVPMVTSLLFDAIDTTAAALAGVLAVLMNSIDELDLLKDRALRDDAIEEALRLATPTPFTIRQAREDVTIADVDFQAGTLVWMWWSAANRDPDVFAAPDSFIMGRGTQALPFGIGPHTCIGHGWTKQLAHILVERALTGPRRLRPLAENWGWKIGGARRPDGLIVRMS